MEAWEHLAVARWGKVSFILKSGLARDCEKYEKRRWCEDECENGLRVPLGGLRAGRVGLRRSVGLIALAEVVGCAVGCFVSLASSAFERCVVLAVWLQCRWPSLCA